MLYGLLFNESWITFVRCIQPFIRLIEHHAVILLLVVRFFFPRYSFSLFLPNFFQSVYLSAALFFFSLIFLPFHSLYF